MKLFGHPDSGHAFKVKFFMHVANIEHDYRVIDIHAPRDTRTDEFRQNTRYQEVPLLLDQGNAYTQSNAILCHLAKRQNSWGAEQSQRWQQCKEWLFWEANKIGMCLPQLRALNKFNDPDINSGAEKWLLGRYHHDIEILDQTLSDGRQFIIDDQLSIADFSLCGYFFYIDEVKLAIPNNVQQWIERLSALPQWQHPYHLLA